MLEVHTIRLLTPNGETIAAEFQLWEEAPGDADFVRLDVVIDGNTISSAMQEDFFSALCSVRQRLEEDGLMPLCYGACETVYPSPMIQSMGDGRKAYALKLGTPARTEDIVCIFGSDESVIPVTVRQQKEFYDSWIKSL